MSYLLEALGRGLLADLRAALQHQLTTADDDDLDEIAARYQASPTSFDLAMRFGNGCLAEARLRDAQSAFEQAHTLTPSAPQPLLGLACVADELGNLEQALDYLYQAQTRDPEDPALIFGIAFCHERAGNTEQAKLAYRRSIELCPHLRNGYERLATIALRENDIPLAVQQYEQLSELEPGDLDILLVLGSLYLQNEQPLEAISQFQNALLIEPDNNDDRPELVEAIAGEGPVDVAIASLEKLVQKYPHVAPFHVQLGDLYVKAGDDERALAEYNTALANQPNFLEATVKLGTQHMRRGRFVDAALTFNRAVELNDRLIGAFAGLGAAQHACGRTNESLATFDLAASLEPSTTLLFSETMRLQLQSEPQFAHDVEDDASPVQHDTLLQEAVRRHQQAIANAPNHADVHYRYGLLLRQLGRHGEATQAFRNAVSINPMYTKALIKLAICLKESGAVDEAIEIFRRALELDGRFVDVHYQLGLLFAQRNQFDLAVEEFEHALTDEMSGPSFRDNLVLALQQIGLVDKAAATWRSICDMSPVTDALLAERERTLRQTQDDQA